MRAGSGRPAFGESSLRAAGLGQGTLEGMTEWLAEVADLAVETVLFLDDVHALPGATRDSALVYLLLNAPPNLRIVLSSRKSVALPISELSTRGRYALTGRRRARHARASRRMCRRRNQYPRAYLAIARSDWPDALGHLERVTGLATRLRRGREIVQAQLLRALATERGELDATGLLDEAISMCRVWGLARIVADTHPDLIALARASAQHAGQQANTTPVIDAPVVATSPAQATANVRIRPGRGSLLSPREREVLRLLASNLSNKQIALAMGVSDETIKWHFKNLFRKLNVGSRSHLLHRARMIGVIDTPSS